MSNPKTKIAIIGAGIQGASIAYHLCRLGYTAVTLFDPDHTSGASDVAAGMLAPVAEAVYGEELLLNMMLESAQYWRELSIELATLFNIDVAYRDGGSMLVGVTQNDVAELERTFRYYQSLNLKCELLKPSQARKIEPSISPSISSAIYTEIDNQVDNRKAHLGLLEASRSKGATLLELEVTQIQSLNDGFKLTFGDSKTEIFDAIILCAGVGSFHIAGVPPYLRNVQRPIRGQVLRLRSIQNHLVPTMVIRTLFDGRSTYIVPRRDGEIVIGASIEEFGTDRTRRARSTYELLRDSLGVVPSLGEFDLAEISVGFRPTASDNFPILGSIQENFHVATGHFRHGILLASYTGKLMAKLIDSGKLPTEVERFSPSRFNNDVQIH